MLKVKSLTLSTPPPQKKKKKKRKKGGDFDDGCKKNRVILEC